MLTRSRVLAVVVFVGCFSGGLLAQERSPALPPPPPNGLPELSTGPPPAVKDPPALLELKDALRSFEAELEARGQDTPAAQRPTDEFEPISGIPLEEQLPAAPMVVAAYIFVLLAFFAYVLSIARRLGAVKQEMARLESELKRSGRS